MTKQLYILSIDTSCDDTSAAVTSGSSVYSNVIASQTELHKQYGGVFPTVAKQAHRENIEATIVLALKRAGVTWAEIKAIAVTQGPGLAPALEVGITKAKELAALHQKPLIPVNHIEGHALSPMARPKKKMINLDEVLVHAKVTPEKVSYPVLSLVISGGHSEFIAITGVGKYERLGWTVDDAAGEVLDKVGRMLGLGYPAGPVIEEFGRLGNPQVITWPLPMTTSGDYNLSFSGLKTAARNLLEKMEADRPLNKTQIYDFCASFQFAVFRAICYKLNKILQKREFSEIWLGGGVAANQELRRMIRETIRPNKLRLRVPYTKRLCQDNAAMIGVVAQLGVPLSNTSTLERAPRLSISDH